MTTRPAVAADAGRACPYCRFAFKQGVDLADCGSCSAAHHLECWNDNGGCAIPGCASGPGAAHAATVVTSPSGTVTATPPGRGSTARTLLLMVGLVTAIAIVAAGAVLIADRDGGDSSDTPARASARSASTASDSPGEASPPKPAPVTATVARTCGLTGDGDCFLSVRSGATADAAELYRLDEGATVRVECQRIGGDTSSSILDSSSRVWSRTTDGGYVANIFLDGPRLDPVARTLPRCD